MKKFFKWAGIVLLAFIVIIGIYAFLGKEQTLNLEIGTVDLQKVPDGTYTGSYDCYRWSNTVSVTVKEHQINDINIKNAPAGREEIDKKLIEKVMEEQSPDVDVISGASADSKSFLKAVENALNVNK